MAERYDAVVVGAGPNGLAAAIELARNGKSVHLIEAAEEIGGGVRAAELTEPGCVHDVCSAAYPLAVASPFFRSLRLEDHGLAWVHPETPLAHPFEDGDAVLLERSLERTLEHLDREDREAYRRTFSPYLANAENLFHEILAPPHPPRSLVQLARFGLLAFRSARDAAKRFRKRRARALFAGLAAHANAPLDAPGTAGVGAVLAIAGHAVGWPIVRGGAGNLANALGESLRNLGATVETGRKVRCWTDLPPCRAVFFDLTPRQIHSIVGKRLSPGVRRRLGRFRYGPGIFKLDWLLREPVPWRNPALRGAGTVHLGGEFDEIVASEEAVSAGKTSGKPFVLATQPSLFDRSRTPDARHTLWAYCHVPNNSALDLTERIEGRIEQFAPGFRDCILARHVRGCADIGAYNANCIGGDISSGAFGLARLFAGPASLRRPYEIDRNIYVCSASTPPGPGVHGMCGFYAARAALHRTFGDG